MDYAEILDMMDDDYDIQGYPLNDDEMNFDEPCWFCGEHIDYDAEAYWSSEWDAPYHLGCLIKALAEGHEEALVIARNEW